MNLLELSGEIAKIFDAIEERGGEITAEDEKALDAIKGPAESKAASVARCILAEDAHIDAVENEIKRLKDVKAKRLARNEWRRGYLLRCMLTSGTKILDAGLMKVSVRENVSVRVDCPTESLPDRFQRVTTSAAPDKQALLKAFKEGEKLPEKVFVVKNAWVKID